MFRVREEDVSFLPKIPAQPIGYAEAQVILQWENMFYCFEISQCDTEFRYLQGNEVESAWRGALSNVTYRYGGELLNSS
jgi:hypothetical protein